MDALVVMPAGELRRMVTEVIAEQLALRVPESRSTPPDDHLISLDETCARTGMSRTTLWRFEKSGELPGIRIGRNVRFRPADVDAFIERRRSTGIDRQRAA